jgi:hypothetical protein
MTISDNGKITEFNDHGHPKPSNLEVEKKEKKEE